jgi:hypothetical protein
VEELLSNRKLITDFMSWIFGYFGNHSNRQVSSLEKSLHSFKDSNLLLFAGGNNQTCFLKSNSVDSCWAVVGVGLETSMNGYKVLDEKNWGNILTSPKIDISKINGHFVAVKYYNGELKFFTDELGLRDIHIVKLPQGFGFSTRIDWLKFFINPEIDLREFGSRWLLQNQVSKNSNIINVNRLICANATIKNNYITIEQNHWQPDFHPSYDREMFDITIRKLLSNDEKKISLSLSGGLDSRMLLSYLLQKNSDLWDTHTFGDQNHPDSKIAFDLLKAFNYHNEILDDALPSSDELIEIVKTYIVESIVTNPVTSILNLRFYEKFTNQNKLIIDGGFGEIWRREFANKLLLLGKKALQQKDAFKIVNLFKYNKGDFFSEEVLREMKSGSIEQIENFITWMPDVNNIGMGNWVDLFSIQARLPNYYAPEQTRVDKYIISFMPLVQKDILKYLFSFDDADKKDGKLFKRLIKQNEYKLAKHPLVKGGIVHPFNSSSLSARLHSRINNRLGVNYQSKLPSELFIAIKEFVMDTIQSSEVKNCKLYDHRKVGRIANDFSTKDYKFNTEIDWFLSFELFRKGLTEH